MPKWILPFAFTKKQAGEKLKKWAAKGLLTPWDFSSAKNFRKLHGFYVPYKVYGCDFDGQLFGTGKKNVRRIAANEVVTRVETYDIDKKGSASYRKNPVYAAAPEKRAEREIPGTLDLSKLCEFDESYLADFSAEEDRDVSFTELKKRLSDRFSAQLKAAAVEGYDEFIIENETVEMKNETVEDALMPLWVYRYQYGKKKYTVLMNGATGEISGKLPKSIGKLLLAFGIAAAVIFAVLFFVGGGLQ